MQKQSKKWPGVQYPLNKATYQRETLSERPIRQPLNHLLNAPVQWDRLHRALIFKLPYII